MEEQLLPLHESDLEQNLNFSSSNNMSSQILIGWREWISLPELGLHGIKAKVDTGARTSALHAFRVEIIENSNKKEVCFSIHPQPKRFPEKIIQCTTPLIDTREVTDSGGHKEQRYVIQTPIVIGQHCSPIEITLTHRDNMRFRMLLGRTALKQHFIIDPSRSYLYSQKE